IRQRKPRSSTSGMTTPLAGTRPSGRKATHSSLALVQALRVGRSFLPSPDEVRTFLRFPPAALAQRLYAGNANCVTINSPCSEPCCSPHNLLHHASLWLYSALLGSILTEPLSATVLFCFLSGFHPKAGCSSTASARSER